MLTENSIWAWVNSGRVMLDGNLKSNYKTATKGRQTPVADCRCACVLLCKPFHPNCEMQAQYMEVLRTDGGQGPGG